MPIYTIGYGNRSIGDFLSLLRHYGVSLLVDTRSIPYSRFQVNFRKQALERSLQEAGLSYLYLGDALGGKKVDPDCLVGGKVDLERLSQKETFQFALGQVLDAHQQGTVLALMCAELRPENCHRVWMLTPPLEKMGVEVWHIDERGGLKSTHEVLSA